MFKVNNTNINSITSWEINFEYDCKQPFRKDLQKWWLEEFSKIVEAYLWQGTVLVKKQAAGFNFVKI